MADKIQLNIISKLPESFSVNHVTLTTQQGDVTLLPGHTPFVAEVIGLKAVHFGSEKEVVLENNGFVKFQDNTCDIICC